MEKTPDYWIRHFDLIPHPEGGYFKETYQSPEIINTYSLPARYSADRACTKAIYFLLPGDQVSKFHRLKCNEIWCYHFGNSLTLYIIHSDGTLQQIALGHDIHHGEQPQVIIPHGVWFGAKTRQQDSYTLISCITVPGFDFDDFELAERQSLLHEYPQHKDIIAMLT